MFSIDIHEAEGIESFVAIGRFLLELFANNRRIRPLGVHVWGLIHRWGYPLAITQWLVGQTKILVKQRLRQYTFF